MKTYVYDKPFVLENGQVLKEITIAYHTYGKLNADKSNVVWVCHALTANSDVADWWDGIFGEGKLLDPNKYFIICANIIGSCYGSTGPGTPLSNRRPLLSSFPELTVRDLVKAHQLLRAHLNIQSIALLIGASLGGQQALEWSIIEPERIEKLILVATNAFHSPYGRAFNESQRLAIEADETFGRGMAGGKKGLIAARSIAMLSYRSYEGYYLTQSEEHHDLPVSRWKAASYQRYQGEKLARRFNAYSYYLLTLVMDSHDVGRKRGEIKEVLSGISAKTLVVGIRSDVLFPVNEQKLLAEFIPLASFIEIDSEYGHDGFLIETDSLNEIFSSFLEQELKPLKPVVKTKFKQHLTLN